MQLLQFTESPHIECIKKLQVQDFVFDPGILFGYIVPVVLISSFLSEKKIDGIFLVLGIACGILVGFIIHMVVMSLENKKIESIRDDIYKTLERASETKKILCEGFNELFELMKDDVGDIGIIPQEVTSISDSIKFLSSKILDYSRNIEEIKDKIVNGKIFYNPSNYEALMNSLVKYEKVELSYLATELSSLIHEWNILHQKELLEVEQELEKQAKTTENLSGQGAIDLQRLRLHEHIENLNQLKNTL